MRPWPSIGSPRSRALSRASPLTPPLTRSPSTRPHGRGVRRSSSHRPGRRPSLATARGRPRGIERSRGSRCSAGAAGSRYQGPIVRAGWRTRASATRPSSARAFAPRVQPGRGVRSSSACLFTISEEWALRWPSPAAPLAKRRLGRRWSDRVLGGPLRGRRTSAPVAASQGRAASPPGRKVGWRASSMARA